MICEKCGVILPDGLEYCTNCGAFIDNVAEEDQGFSKFNKFGKIFLALILAVVLIFGGYKGIYHIRTNLLHSDMTRQWRRYCEDGTVLEFNISKDSIEYVVGYESTRKTLATFEYDVVSPDEIILSNRFAVYKVKINKDKTKMTVTPAITSTDGSEEWFYLE